MVIVDTTVWIDYFQGVKNPETDWLDAELDRQRLGLTDIILCEVLQGVRDDSVAKEVEQKLQSWNCSTQVVLRWLVRQREIIGRFAVAGALFERRSTA